MNLAPEIEAKRVTGYRRGKRVINQSEIKGETTNQCEAREMYVWAQLWTLWEYQRTLTDRATGQTYNTKEQLPFSWVPLPSLLSMDDDRFLPSKSEVSVIMNTCVNYGWIIYTKKNIAIFIANNDEFHSAQRIMVRISKKEFCWSSILIHSYINIHNMPVILFIASINVQERLSKGSQLFLARMTWNQNIC